MTRMLLEVIVQTVDDAKEATRGGADRLEVVRSIEEGGLTPPIDLVRAIADATPLPLRVMLRENAGFETTAAEMMAMRETIRALEVARVDGVVIGFAANGEPLLDPVREILGAAPTVKATFHRAFDTLNDPLSAVTAIAAIDQIDRILTSGGEGSAVGRGRRLQAIAARGKGRLTIVAGGGVDESCVAVFRDLGCVAEVHVGRAVREGQVPGARVLAASVQRIRDLLDSSDRL